ncbi:DNA-directed RNA polymerase [Pantoea agglomerans]
MCYFKQKKVSISTLILGKEVRAKVSEDDKDINAAKQSSGVAPNYVHSMDACHLRMTVNLANEKYGIKAFSLVHDSFGTHARMAMSERISLIVSPFTTTSCTLKYVWNMN